MLYRLGYLLTHFNPARLVEAKKHFDTALDLDPDYALAWAGLGYIRYLRSDYEAAHTLYQQALEGERREFLIHFLAGINLMKWVSAESRLAPGDPEQQARLQEARAAFRRSISLRSNFAEAYAGLGSTFVGAQEPSEEGLEALQRARSFLPQRADITFNMAILAARLGHRELAVDLVEGVLVTQADAETVDNAREGILRVELIAADRHLRKGDLEAGLAIMDSVAERTIDSDLFAELVQKANEIRRMLAAAADRELFNEAMDLARRSRYDEAIMRLEELLVSASDAELRKVAKENLRRLRQLP
jgi:tetratricopeptide (TPR) repeat protein